MRNNDVCCTKSKNTKSIIIHVISAKKLGNFIPTNFGLIPSCNNKDYLVDSFLGLKEQKIKCDVILFLPLQIVPTGSFFSRLFADIGLKEGRRARLLAELERVEAVGVALAPAVVEGHAPFLRVVKIPVVANNQSFEPKTSKVS